MIEQTLISRCDDLPLHLEITVPEDTALEHVRGVIQIAHGMAEYGARYLPFMEYCSRQGYVCVVCDHRGHGKSVKNQDDWGFFYDTTGQYIVEDMHQVTSYIKKQYPNVPLFLFCHSMGTLVGRCYLKQYDDEAKRVILCGAPCRNSLVGFGILLTKLLRVFRGDHYKSSLLHQMADGMYAKSFASEGEVAWISSDPAQVKKYENDTCCGFAFTVNGYRNLFLLLKETFSKRGWRMKNPQMPILFIAGAEDPVIGGTRAFEQTAEFLRQRGYQNVETKLYKGKRHELLNEDIRQNVYKDVVEWLDGQEIYG